MKSSYSYSSMLKNMRILALAHSNLAREKWINKSKRERSGIQMQTMKEPKWFILDPNKLYLDRAAT